LNICLARPLAKLTAHDNVQTTNLVFVLKFVITYLQYEKDVFYGNLISFTQSFSQPFIQSFVQPIILHSHTMYSYIQFFGIS
jgi:hypothetical protein